MPEVPKPVDQLRALHKEDPTGELRRPDILVVERVDAVRAATYHYVQALFPGYNIHVVSNGADARGRISTILRTSLAMVLADTQDLPEIAALLADLRQTRKADRL